MKQEEIDLQCLQVNGLIQVNLENLNSVYINEGMEQSNRLIKLNSIAIHQMTLLTSDTRIKKLEKITQDKNYLC